MSSGSDSEIDDDLQDLLIHQLSQINERRLNGDNLQLEAVTTPTGKHSKKIGKDKRKTKPKKNTLESAEKKIVSRGKQSDGIDLNGPKPEKSLKKAKSREKEDLLTLQKVSLGVKKGHVKTGKESNINAQTSEIDSDEELPVASPKKKVKKAKKKVDCTNKSEKGSREKKDCDQELTDSRKQKDDDKHSGKPGASPKKKTKVTKHSQVTEQEELESESDDAFSDDEISDFDDFDDFSDDQLDDSVVGQSSEVTRNLEKRLEQFKQTLGLTEEDFVKFRQKKEENEGINQGNLQKPGTKKRGQPEVIVFEDPAKRRKKNQKPVVTSSARTSMKGEGRTMSQLNLHTVRHEVHQFGIQGLDKSSKEKATLDLLVSLGAKKPKNPNLNYKEFLAQKKEEKLARIEAENLNKQQDKHYKGSSTGQGKTKNKRKGSEFGDGQLGKYRGGVQVIGKGDLERIKNTRTNKRRR